MTKQSAYCVFLRTQSAIPTDDEVREHPVDPSQLPQAIFIATKDSRRELDICEPRLEVLAAKIVWEQARVAGIVKKLPGRTLEETTTGTIIIPQNMTLQFNFIPPYTVRVFGLYRQYTVPLSPALQEDFLQQVSKVMLERILPANTRLYAHHNRKYVIIDKNSPCNGTTHTQE